MRFLTAEECKAWARPEQKDENGWPEWTGEGRDDHWEGGLLPTCAAAFRLARAVDPWRRCLLWVRITGVFEDLGNQHLYYRLRQSYGDGRLVEDAPGHLFLEYERADFVSFLQVVIGNGWDANVLTDSDYGRLSVSHDEYFDASFSTPEGREEFLA